MALFLLLDETIRNFGQGTKKRPREETMPYPPPILRPRPKFNNLDIIRQSTPVETKDGHHYPCDRSLVLPKLILPYPLPELIMRGVVKAHLDAVPPPVTGPLKLNLVLDDSKTDTDKFNFTSPELETVQIQPNSSHWILLGEVTIAGHVMLSNEDDFKT